MSRRFFASDRAVLAANAVIVSMAVCIAAVVLTVSPSHAQQPTSTQECDAAADVKILMLFDTSGSLRWTDPDERRMDGGIAALDDLRRLAAHYAGTTIVVAVDSFAGGYDEGQWLVVDSEPGSRMNAALRARVRDVATRDSGALTDYREAINGADRRMAAWSDSSCRLVFWFTDGAHDSVRRTEGVLTPAESEQIDALCAPGSAGDRLNRSGVEVHAVHLAPSPGDELPETLRRLYGQSDLLCGQRLDGDIVAVQDTAKLVRKVSGIVEDSLFEAIEQPGETYACTADSQQAGSDRSVCEYEFTIASDTQAFSMFIELKDLEDPNDIEVLMRQPGIDHEMPIGFVYNDPEPKRHPPTNLLTRSPTTNWRQIMAHKAFTSSWGPDQAERRDHWHGEWTVVFRGSESALARVTPPRVTLEGTPQLLANLNGNSIAGEVLIDEIQGDPEFLQSFRGQVKLSVESETNVDGFTVGSQDGYFVSEEDGLRWSVQRITDALLSVPGMADHLKSSDGEVRVKARLVQDLEWDDLRQGWEFPKSVRTVSVNIDRVAWAEDAQRHPSISGVSAASPVSETGEFNVEAVPGSMPGALTLNEVTAMSADDENITVELSDSWYCDVPTDQPADCPPIVVDVHSDTDDVADFEFLFVAELHDSDSLIEQAERQGLGEEARGAYEPVNRTASAEATEINVVDSDERRLIFVTLLLIIAATAAALRLNSAWRGRRWAPLMNLYAVSIPVLHKDGEVVRLDGSSLTSSKEDEKSVALKLTQHISRGEAGQVRLRTDWRKPLSGGAPVITASAMNSECWSKQGKRKDKGIVGNTLRDGWAYQRQGDEDFLVVWDLPSDGYQAVKSAAEEAADVLNKDPDFLADAGTQTDTANADADGEPELSNDPLVQMNDMSLAAEPFNDPFAQMSKAPVDDPLEQSPNDPFN